MAAAVQDFKAPHYVAAAVQDFKAPHYVAAAVQDFASFLAALILGHFSLSSIPLAKNILLAVLSKKEKRGIITLFRGRPHLILKLHIVRRWMPGF